MYWPFDRTNRRNVVYYYIFYISGYYSHLRRKWYSLGVEGLSEEERYALNLIEPSIYDCSTLRKGNDIFMEYIDESKKVTEDFSFGASYDKELAYGDLREEEGKKEGRKEGIKESTYSIAKNMKNIGIKVEYISNCTGLSIEQIEEI